MLHPLTTNAALKSLFEFDFSKMNWGSLISIILGILKMLFGNKDCGRSHDPPKQKFWLPLLGSSTCETVPEFLQQEIEIDTGSGKGSKTKGDYFSTLMQGIDAVKVQAQPSMNGAITIGTLDGANVEIRELVGEENFFLFGHDEKGIADLWQNGYNPQSHMSDELWEVINLIKGGHFSHGDRNMFEPVMSNLLNHDPFCVIADFSYYCDAQDRVGSAWKEKDRWNKMSLLNIARSGFFSSDRSIREYCESIWGV